MKYIFIVLLILALIIIFYIIRNIIRSKNVNKNLINVCKENNCVLIKAKSKGYDYIIRASNRDVYLKVAFVPSHSQICINAKETWKLSWAPFKQDAGKSYPNSRYMTELENFLDKDIITKTDKEVLKVIYIYKRFDSVIRYLNETELDTIDINKSPYNYKVTSLENFNNDIKVILK